MSPVSFSPSPGHASPPDSRGPHGFLREFQRRIEAIGSDAEPSDQRALVAKKLDYGHLAAAEKNPFGG